MAKSLRIRFEDPENEDREAATEIVLDLPDDMRLSDARDYILWRVNREMERYGADQCARHYFTR